MTDAELKDLMEDVALCVRQYFAEAVKPLVERIDQLEKLFDDAKSGR